jgi:transposase-like protein
MFNSETIEEARKKRDEIIRDYQDIAEKAMSCLDEGFEDAMTVMVLPKNLRKKLRTSNHIERLNKELKRRSKVIDIFPNQESLIRLMGAVLVEINEKKKLDRNRIIFSTDMEIMSKLKPVLQEIAKEQQAVLVA